MSGRRTRIWFADSRRDSTASHRTRAGRERRRELLQHQLDGCRQRNLLADRKRWQAPVRAQTGCSARQLLLSALLIVLLCCNSGARPWSAPAFADHVAGRGFGVVNRTGTLGARATPAHAHGGLAGSLPVRSARRMRRRCEAAYSSRCSRLRRSPPASATSRLGESGGGGAHRKTRSRGAIARCIAPTSARAAMVLGVGVYIQERKQSKGHGVRREAGTIVFARRSCRLHRDGNFVR